MEVVNFFKAWDCFADMRDAVKSFDIGEMYEKLKDCDFYCSFNLLK